MISRQDEHKITKNEEKLENNDSQSKAVKKYEERQETIKNAFNKYFELIAKKSDAVQQEAVLSLLNDEPPIKHIDLGNVIRPYANEEAVYLAFVNLLNKTNVSALSLRHCEMWGATAKIFFDALKTNKSIKQLDLAWNHIRSDLVIEALKKNRTLLWLNLEENAIPLEGCFNIGKALPEFNKNLVLAGSVVEKSFWHPLNKPEVRVGDIIGDEKSAELPHDLMPLWLAAGKGNIDAVFSKLAAKVNPNGFDELPYFNPMVLAAKYGHEKIVDLLRSQHNFDIRSLPDAIGHVKIAEKLTASQDINQLNAEGLSLLHIAVGEGYSDEVRKLIKRGADVNLKSKHGICPLHIAAAGDPPRVLDLDGPAISSNEPPKQYLEIIKILLENKADPNARGDWDEKTAMEIAGSQGDYEALQLLLSITKKSNRVKFGITMPWYLDIMFQSMEPKQYEDINLQNWLNILKLLRSEGADLSIKHPDNNNYTLLHLFMHNYPYCSQSPKKERIFNENLKVINFLLDNDVDPAAQNKDGRTALELLDPYYFNDRNPEYNMIANIFKKVKEEHQSPVIFHTLSKSQHTLYAPKKPKLSMGQQDTALIYQTKTKKIN